MDVATGKAQGKGPVGFSAAMLPFLQNRDAQAVQRQRVADNFPGSDAYYNYVLTLFGQGWDQHRFRFSTKGELLPDWGRGMRKFTLNIFTLSLGLAVMPMVEAAPTAQQQLLEQVRLGEATHREDLVQQSLYRLELIDPNNPDVVAARFRSLLRQGDIDGAQKQLDRLSQLAPSSNAYKSSRTTMLLSTPDGRQALQQARLQATTGHAEEAVASYNKLFNGAPPEGDIAVEYWSTVAKIPARRGEAINQLKRINADTPGNTGLQNNLALLLFSSDRRDEGFAVSEQMAKSNAGREGASKIWYGQIKDMPVSDASVSALKKYLSIFSDGDSVAAAQSQLAEQQKQLADPAFRARAQGLAAVDSGMAGKAIPELQQAVRANPKDSEALGGAGPGIFTERRSRQCSGESGKKPSHWTRTAATTTNGTVC